MTANLYDALGITRDADADEVKAAYRRKAKAAHPDTGGDAAAFQTVSRAYTVLSDADRRARYDRTGTVEDTVADNEHGAALGIIRGAMEQVFQQIGGNGPIEVDIVERMKAGIIERRDQIEAEIAAMEATATSLARFADRFSRKNGDTNVLRRMVENKIQQIQQTIPQAQAALGHLNEAIAILSDHSFRIDPPPERPLWMQQMSAAATRFAVEALQRDMSPRVRYDPGHP